MKYHHNSLLAWIISTISANDLGIKRIQARKLLLLFEEIALPCIIYNKNEGDQGKLKEKLSEALDLLRKISWIANAPSIAQTLTHRIVAGFSILQTVASCEWSPKRVGIGLSVSAYDIVSFRRFLQGVFFCSDQRRKASISNPSPRNYTRAKRDPWMKSSLAYPFRSKPNCYSARIHWRPSLCLTVQNWTANIRNSTN